MPELSCFTMAEFKKIISLPVKFDSGRRLLSFGAIFLWAFLLPACGSEISREDYLEWITSYTNGLHVRKNVDEFVFDLQYKPAELVAAEQRGNLAVASGSLQYFTLKIGDLNERGLIRHNAYDAATLQQNLYYFSYLFQNSIFIEYGGVKYPCVLYHFEQSPDSKKMAVFNLGFDAPSFEEDVPLYLEISSDKLYSLPVRLKVTLNNVPKLQL